MNELFLAIIAILLSGICSGSEIAFTHTNWIRLKTWEKNHTPSSLLKLRATATLRLLTKKELILTIILIFNNLFNIITSAIITRFFIVHFGSTYTTVAILITVILLLIFGEFLPKAIAQTFPEHWAAATSPIFGLLSFIFSPFFPKLKNTKQHTLSRKDFLYLLKENETKESLVTNQMAKALFDFSRLSVYEIMVPKERIVAFSESADFKHIKQIVDKFRFSRYPVYKKSDNNIVGIIHIKDILMAISQQKITLKDVFRKPYFVTPEEKATNVLKAMSQKGEHLAVVHNEKNQTVGIVTLEDLLEEVVGEIRSET